MFYRVDEQLLREAARYRLVFTCERCVEFDPEGERCSLGFPIAPHRDPDLRGREEVIFCKTFELW